MSIYSNELTIERLHELFDVVDRKFIGKEAPIRRGNERADKIRNTKSVGKVMGWTHSKGYTSIRVDGKEYLEHKLLYFWEHGAWPDDQIDHIDGNPSNNDPSNLRQANNAENHQNLKMVKSNTSGYIGVIWDKKKRKWRADIKLNYKGKFLGYFDNPETAHHAYLHAKEQYHTFQPIPR